MKKHKPLLILISFYIILMPFEEALSSSFGSILKVFGIAIILYGLVLLMSLKVYFSIVHIAIILWLSLSFASYFWVESFTWWSYFFNIYLGQALFLIILTALPKGIVKINTLSVSLVIGSLLASIFLIFFPQVSHFTDEGRRSISLLGTTLDPNIVSAIISLGIFSMFDYIKRTNREYRNLGFLILFAIMISGVFFTGSRGGLIAILLATLIGVTLGVPKQKKKFRLFLTILLIMIVTLAVLKILPGNLLETRFSFSHILGLNEFRSGSHNRYTIWLHAIQLFMEKPLFGFGTGNFLSAMSLVYRQAASHNMFLLILIENGLIGIIIFIIPLVWTLKRLYNINNYIVMGMFISTIFFGFSLDGITYKFFWVSWIYAILTIKNSKQDKKRYII